MDLLLDEIRPAQVIGDPSKVQISSVELDSRQVLPGSLFCCLPGELTDGHEYAGDALERGAVGLLAERALELAVPQAIVSPGEGRAAMARVAAAFYGHPAERLLTVGVTGTNGKTTVTHLVSDILASSGRLVEVLGTLEGVRTTPEAPALQRRMAEACQTGKEAFVMEVSSHGLVQHRVDGFAFDVATFTNLGHDHLDYHGTMERYFEAKASLFTPEHARLGVVDVTGEWGQRLASCAPVPLVSFSILDASDVELTRHGTCFTWRSHRVRTRLVGMFNVSNTLAAMVSCAELGIPLDEVVAGMEMARGVPGRFELVGSDEDFSVVVDYAHTPDGIGVALAAARQVAGDHRVLLVFGCGGDRDHAKRPLMGAAAVAGADRVVLTTDNPRSEDPSAIAAEVLAGVEDRASLTLELDRARAIELAIAEALPGDVVLVAGKGHETTMEVAGRVLPFDDREVVRGILDSRHPSAGRPGRGRQA